MQIQSLAGRHTCSGCRLLALTIGVLLGIGVFVASVRGMNPTPSEPSEPAPVSVPMAAFARMEPGEWRLGTTHATTWTWGPGGHSIRAHRIGSDVDDNPWRELLIYYYRPDRKQIHLLSFHPDIPGIGRGVGQGTFEIDGDSAAASLELDQPRARRKLASRWTFEGPDKYRETLLEHNGRRLAPIAEWEYVRSMEPAASPEADPEPDRIPTPSKNIRAFVPLLGPWESREQVNGSRLGTTFEWMEYLDVVSMRLDWASGTGTTEQLLVAYLYHHVGRNELRCLALSATGEVYEGGVSLLQGRSLELDLMRHGGEEGSRRLVRFDFESDGSLRARVWSVDGDDRRIMHDIIHRRTSLEED